jgi:3-oxoacyl-[acyl-carrier-protein] synthase-3
VPPKILDNEELIFRFGEKPIKSITKMSGVKKRRVVSDGICASDLSFRAADRLIREKGIKRSSIDLLIFISETPDHLSPPTSCILHDRLNLSQNCGAFDINLGCSALPYGLSLAHSYIKSGLATRVLLLIADALTPIIHPMDRGLVPLHGDAGAALLIDRCDSECGHLGFLLGTDGSGHKHLKVEASGARCPKSEETKKEIADESGSVRTAEHLYMNGPAVFHFSLRKIPTVILEALRKFNLHIGELDLILLHQANKTMIDLIYKHIGASNAQRFLHIENIGNTAAAASPVLLAEAWRQDRILPGSKTLICSFGVGLSWSIAYIKWPCDNSAKINASIEYGDMD